MRSPAGNAQVWLLISTAEWIAIGGTFSASLPKSFQSQGETSEIGSVSKPGGGPVVCGQREKPFQSRGAAHLLGGDKCIAGIRRLPEPRQCPRGVKSTPEAGFGGARLDA